MPGGSFWGAVAFSSRWQSPGKLKFRTFLLVVFLKSLLLYYLELLPEEKNSVIKGKNRHYLIEKQMYLYSIKNWNYSFLSSTISKVLEIITIISVFEIIAFRNCKIPALKIGKNHRIWENILWSFFFRRQYISQSFKLSVMQPGSRGM